VDNNQSTETYSEKNGILAAVQLHPRIGDVDHNLELIEQSLAALKFQEHNLVVFPEMVTTGYFFEGKKQLKSLTEIIPDGPTTEHLISLAKKFNTYLVVGLPELENGLIYNTAVIVGPAGYISKYRKLHLWDEEKLIFEPGNLGLTVVDLPFAKVGIMICYDLWFLEQIRVLRMMGADVIAVPAALVWNDTPAHVKRKYYMANYVSMAAAHLNQVYLALASQVGNYGNHWLFGSSAVTGPYGWLLGEPAGDQEPQIIDFEVDFNLGKRIRGWGKLDDFDRDRRVDVYDKYLGVDIKNKD